MKRRTFITLLGGVAATPLAAQAQQAIPVVGFLSGGSAAILARRAGALRRGLEEAGYAEGRNVAIEFRWAGDQGEQFPALAADLVRRQVAVIVAGGNASVAAIKAATGTIPIVFTTGGDPVQLGLVASLNRPGGNITGVAALVVELGPKRLDLLRELVPTATTIAVLVNPANPARTETLTRDAQAAARALGLQILVLHASSERDFDSVLASLRGLRVDALIIGSDPYFISHAELLGALTVRHQVPAIYQYREFTSAGGLLSYGGSVEDSYRLAGIYAGRILKGDKPADLPVVQPTKFELIINLKTAKALGLTVPPKLLFTADEVIE